MYMEKYVFILEFRKCTLKNLFFREQKFRSKLQTSTFELTL